MPAKKRILKNAAKGALAAAALGALSMGAIHHREIGGALFTAQARIRTMFSNRSVVDEYRAHNKPKVPEYFKTKMQRAAYHQDLLEATIRKASRTIERLRQRKLFGYRFLKELEFDIMTFDYNLGEIEKALGKNSAEFKTIKQEVEEFV
ncbi:MAG: hypothetical protein Q7K42_02180, partial [Candidatus Diapherotrites archaeon]|nr:hypothetical protein [Candidatus Diapherotrites archaeon]